MNLQHHSFVFRIPGTLLDRGTDNGALDSRASGRGEHSPALHALWTEERGFHLWCEIHEGYDDTRNRSLFPPVVASILSEGKKVHPLSLFLRDLDGEKQEKEVSTFVYTPEQAVQILKQLSMIDSLTATPEQRKSIAPDLRWFIHLFQGLEAYVRSGRVGIEMTYSDGEWFPTWTLVQGKEEKQWLSQVNASAPGIVTENMGMRPAEQIASSLVHWIAYSILGTMREEKPRAQWHSFTSALLHADSFSQGGESMWKELKKWNKSTRIQEMELVFLVEGSPHIMTEQGSIVPLEVLSEEEIEDKQKAHSKEHSGEEGEEYHLSNDYLWPVRLRARIGQDPLISIDNPLFLPEYQTAFQTKRRDAIRLSPLVNSRRLLPQDHPAYSPQSVQYSQKYSGIHNNEDLTLVYDEEDTEGMDANSFEHSDWDVYLSTEEIKRFIATDVNKLQGAGFAVLLPQEWKKKMQAQIHLDASNDNLVPRINGMNSILDFAWKVSLGNQELTEAEMIQLMNTKTGLVQVRGKWVIADPAVINKINSYMEALTSPSEDEEKLSGQATIAQLRELAMLMDSSEDFSGDPWYKALVEGDTHFETPAPRRVDIPPSVKAELREYQRRGVDWLLWMSNQGLGVILADDMGLGKTLQLLTLEAVEREEDNSIPSLVVVPAAVLKNWYREAQKFTPHLRVLIQHGSQRKKKKDFFRQLADVDIVLTTYGTLKQDFPFIKDYQWRRIILDEAQIIKNPDSAISRVTHSLQAQHRVAMTGTPVENKLSELRSIMDFCNKGILGSRSAFRNRFARPIEVHHNEETTERLRSFTAPFILRRVKTDKNIIADLPDKTEKIVTIPLTTEQAALYGAYVNELERTLEELTPWEKRMLVAVALTRIKQICNHPAHYLADGSPMTIKNKHRSGKVEELIRLLDYARDTSQKVLIFTQFRVFGDMLQSYLSSYTGQEIPFYHGGISHGERDEMVQDFQREDGPPIMLLTLKAAGVGLNLTQASMVIHVDRWWNPAVENQATDRAYRIGQKKNVTVYKMVCAGTLEERINEVILSKQELAGVVIGATEKWISELPTEDIVELMRYRESSIQEAERMKEELQDTLQYIEEKARESARHAMDQESLDEVTQDVLQREQEAEEVWRRLQAKQQDLSNVEK